MNNQIGAFPLTEEISERSAVNEGGTAEEPAFVLWTGRFFILI